ncbi:MAG: peptidoglycan/LPS O-acetylase OafA/YrhL [Verrucomicrobiales bacterium]|jgi:peptidoglycan/LPS O-acetylase OafA/YrhL
MNLIREPFGKHIPCLDGVRGVAVLLVLCRHLLPVEPIGFIPLEYARKVLEAGWIGVDLFFVLSGFLITGILLDTRGSNRSFRNFYARRSLRIFPLYFFVLLVGLVILPVAGIHYEGMQINLENQLWLWTYASNFAMAFQDSYLFTADGFILSHLWSLAVEEHFYLVWPFAVLSLSWKPLLRICLGTIVIALALRCTLYLSGVTGIANYVLTFCRMDSLMFGALLAIGCRIPAAQQTLRTLTPVTGCLSGAGLAIILVTTKGWWVAHWSMQTVGFTLLAIFFSSALYILLNTSDGNWFRRAFSLSPLRFLGKYSYGIYIYHSILDAHLERWIPDASGPFATIPILGPFSILIARVALVLPLVLLSFHFLESPFLRLKDRFTTKTNSESAPSKSVPALTTATQ